MAGDLAAKQSRAQMLRAELSGLRVEGSAALEDGHNAVLEVKLDNEIEQLENQIRIQKERNANGGSVIEAMEAMAAAAAAEAAEAEAASAAKAAVTPPPVESVATGLSGLKVSLTGGDK